ncbi:MAG: hypothetical protein GYB68_08510 [Chloroflexi bacterium]|nr:hypothetical protein [Chloroflexota bacterium]
MDPIGHGIVIQDHQRSYDDPIYLVAGEFVWISQQDVWDDQHVWLWCANEDGKQGWVPEPYITVSADGSTGLARRVYDAIELSVFEGESLRLLEEQSGWYWAENNDGQRGWVPVSHIDRT